MGWVRGSRGVRVSTSQTAMLIENVVQRNSAFNYGLWLLGLRGRYGVMSDVGQHLQRL